MSSSPYQSRLFSFLNRQSLRWRDRFGKTTRQLKVAAEWGVQILVYPVYLLVQTGRLFGQKIEQSADYPELTASSNQNENLNPSISADQPITEVLTLVDPWIISDQQTLSSADNPTIEQLSQQIQKRVQNVLEKRDQSSLVSQVTQKIQKAITGEDQTPLSIQGIASLLENQNLVLVANNNQVFNILSSEQQDTLNKRIRTELANYYYEKRLYQLIGRHFPSLIPQFTEKDQKVLPPVRWFWRTMRWVQTSEVAISLNVFGESSLIETTPMQDIKLDNPEFPQGEWGERELITKNAPNQPDLSQLNHLIRSAIDYFYGGLQNTPLKDSQQLQQLTEASAIIKETLQDKVIQPTINQLEQLKQQIYQQVEEPDPFRLQVILEAAIAHFFTESSPKTVNPPLKGSKVESEDPWLTSDDIFPILPPSIPSQLLESPLSALPSALVVVPSLPKTSNLTPKTEVNRAKLAKISPIPSLTPNSSVTDVPLSEIKSNPLPQTNRYSPIIPTVNNVSEHQEIDFSPDWIETEFQPVGYVKHPLERLLKVLDQVILWLEEGLVKLGRIIIKIINKYVKKLTN